MESLILGGTKATGVGFAALAALPLKSIGIPDGNLSEPVFEGLGKVKSLETLSFGDARMSPGWLKHLAGLPNLRSLWLPSSTLDDASAKAVGTFPALENLTASPAPKLTDAGLAELVKAPKLKVLNVQSSKVTKEGVAKAKAARPDLNISASVDR